MSTVDRSETTSSRRPARVDRVTGAVILALSAVVFWDLRDLPFMTDNGPGASFVPYLLATIWVVLGLVIIVSSTVPRTTRGDVPLSTSNLSIDAAGDEPRAAGDLDADLEPDADGGPRGIARSTLVLAGIVAGVLLAYVVGLVPALFLSTIFLVKVVEQVRWRTSLIVSAGIAGGIYLIFEVLMGVPLEHGLWG